MRRLAPTVQILLAIACAPRAALGQTELQIAGKPSCASCRVIVTPIATLKAPDTGEPFGLSAITMDSTGRFFVISQNRAKISVFTPTGQFIREIGKAGAGPGEWTRVSMVAIGPGDSVLVVDGNRLTILSPSLAYIRTVQLPVRAFRLFPTGNGQFVAFAHTGAGGYNAHLVDGERLVRSFGWSTQPTPDRQCMACTDQRISAGPTNGTVWISTPNRYNVELWRTDGRLDTHLEITQADWFEPWSTNPSVGDGIRPKSSTVLGAFSDAAGRLWIHGVHAPASWKPHALPEGLSASSGAIRILSMDALETYVISSDEIENETVIDIIDLAGKAVMARFRFPGSLEMINASVAFYSKLDADGAREIHVVRLSLAERSP